MRNQEVHPAFAIITVCSGVEDNDKREKPAIVKTAIPNIFQKVGNNHL
jgi:hypothetical protein